MVDELEVALLKAAESLGSPRVVSPELWKEMLGRQFLVLSSSISVSMMSGRVDSKTLKEEQRRNNLIQAGLRDGLAGIKERNRDEDYLSGFHTGNNYRVKEQGPLSQPENIGLY